MCAGHVWQLIIIWLDKATRILADDKHVLYADYILLPSSRRFRTVTCKTNRKRFSFVPMSIRLLNNKSLGHYFKDESVILYVSVYIPCDIFATTILRIRISCVGRNSDVHFLCTYFFFFFITIEFVLTFTRTLHTNFPFTGQ